MYVIRKNHYRPFAFDRSELLAPILLMFLLLSCQHAEVTLSPALLTPAQRQQGRQRNSETSAAFPERNGPFILKQNYYFWGFCPRELVYEESVLCPGRGIRKISQISTLSDLTLEQLTIGIYSPRTMEVICH